MLASALMLPLFLWAASGSVSYEYDAAGRLRKTTFQDGTKSDYTLDASGNRTVVASTLGGGLVTLSVASSVSEATGSLTVTAIRSGSANGAISISYATSNGAATAGSDYTATSGTLSWANGDSANKSFTVPITNDSNYEAAETFVVTLSNPTNGSILGSPSQATVTITNDDAAPTFAITSALSVGEAAGSVTVTVTKSGSTTLSHAVNYATANGTATSGSDYTATSGTLTFASNETSKTFTVPIINNSTYGGNKAFSINLNSPTNGATLGASTATATIQEDESAPSFSINNVSINETAGSATFTVTKTGASALSHVINYQTNNGTAIAGTDYTAVSGALTFGAGGTGQQQIVVPVTNDETYRGTRTFQVALSSATNGATISSGTGTGTIADNELIPIVLTVSDITASQIRLSWTPTGNGTGNYWYQIWPSFSEDSYWVDNATQMLFGGMLGGFPYNFTVYPYDAGTGKWGSPSFIQATTLMPPPIGLSAIGVSQSQINLSWTQPYSGTAIAGYKIYRNGSQVGTSGTTSFSDTGLAASTSYSYTVATYDASGNTSVQSASASATTAAPAYYASMTVGTNFLENGDGTYRQGAGYNDPVSFQFGSYTPTALGGGKYISSFFDYGLWGFTLPGYINIRGFSSDPGVAWLTSATANGVTVTGTSAWYYHFGNGVASWGFNQSFGLDSQIGNTISVAIVHQ